MTGAVTCRPASIEDLDALADIYLASRRTFLPFAELAHSADEVRAWVHGALYQSGGLWTIRAGDDLVGMLAISERERVGWIDQLYLRPGATGRGIGSIALEHAVGVLPPPVRLYTFQANSGARRFYERHGFRAISFSDNSNNEERCPDVLYERTGKDG